MIGITLDKISNLDLIVGMMKEVPYPLAVRLVCDPGMHPKDYDDAVTLLSAMSTVFIQPVDSSEMRNLSVEKYVHRNRVYMEYFGNRVYAFEVGNEINGKWCGTDVAEKVNGAMQEAMSRNVKTMVTMFAQASDEDPDFEPLTWLKNNTILAPYISALSIYPRQWDLNQQPDVDVIFQGLANYWPDAIQMIGEFGWDGNNESSEPTNSVKNAIMEQWYNYDAPHGVNYHIGGFYWEAAEEMNLLLPVLQSLSSEQGCP